MSGRIVEGLWDCQYCGADKIGGLQKHCPQCGHPQSKDLKFYLGEQKRYLSDEELAERSTEPDWLCEYCNSLNNSKFVYCKNCGAPRTAENKDYFQMHEENKEIVSTPAEDDVKNDSENIPWFKKKSFKIFAISFAAILAIGLLICGLVAIFAPKEYVGVVNEKSWERDVVIEEYRTVEESAWDRVPAGGRLLYSNDEIRSYQSILSHYETKTREVAEQVLDGYDTHTYYTDNGDGTFTEHTQEIPRYKTVYRTETYEEPVYISVPVYDTKYYYEIERWMYDRTEESEGVNNEPYWPEYVMADNERVGSEEETYVINFYVEEKDKSYSYTCEDKAEWDIYSINEEKVLTVSGGKIVEIEE